MYDILRKVETVTSSDPRYNQLIKEKIPFLTSELLSPPNLFDNTLYNLTRFKS